MGFNLEIDILSDEIEAAVSASHVFRLLPNESPVFEVDRLGYSVRIRVAYYNRRRGHLTIRCNGVHDSLAAAAKDFIDGLHLWEEV